MDYEIISKLIFGLVSSLGTIALVFYNLGKARKIKAELLEKFEGAVERKSMHSATELFRLIHGLRMSYSDIIVLIKHDHCSKIIYALKKTPGMVSYQDGEFKYTNLAKNKIFRFTDRWFIKLSIWAFSVFGLISLAMLGFGTGATAISGFVFLLFCSVMLALQLKQKHTTRWLEILSNNSLTKLSSQNWVVALLCSCWRTNNNTKSRQPSFG